MGYITENLMEGETVVYEGRMSVWALMKWLLPGAIMITFIFADAWWGTTVFALGVGMMTAALIQMATTEMAVTTERVIAKRGWIARRTTEISLSRVEGVEVNQSINQRLLNYGHILVSGVGSHKAKISSVAAPLEFRKAFLQALEDREDSMKGKDDGNGQSNSTSGLIEQQAGSGNRTETLKKEVKPSSDRDMKQFEYELAELVTEINGSWVVLDKEEFLSFIQKWKSTDKRAMSLISLNNGSDVLENLRKVQN